MFWLFLQVEDFLAQNRDKLIAANVGTGLGALVFSDLVKAMRTATQAMILRVLKDDSNKEIV